jgi:hypothetical protein
MDTTDTTSLMDDLDFLGAIEKLEATPKAGMLDIFPSELKAYAGRRGVRSVKSAAAPQFMMPAAAAAAPNVEVAQSPGMRPALAALGFALMMSIGAGAAALVFHDRVVQIVAQWQSASR